MTDATVFSERLGVRHVNASPTRRNRGDLLSGPGKAVAILRDGANQPCTASALSPRLR